MKFAAGLVAIIASAQVVAASSGRPIDIPERARGAESVVVGTIIDTSSSLRTNQHGDQLIVTRAVVEVEEVLKGRPASTTIEVDVEGGTIGDLTLLVSDMPMVAAGERATFFLSRGEAGAHVPHLRGLGILKLADNDVVPGTSLALREIKRLVASTQR